MENEEILSGFVIIRLDGKGFSKLTRALKVDDEYNPRIDTAMQAASLELCKQIQGVVLAYTISDEISLVIDMNSEDKWYGGRRDKLLSVSASVATAAFAQSMGEFHWFFDSRIVSVPNNIDGIRDYFHQRKSNGFANAMSSYASRSIGHKDTMYVGLQDRIQELESAGISVHDGLAYGHWIERTPREEEVTFTHRKTGKQETVLVHRSPWTVKHGKTLPVDLLTEAW